MTIWNKPGLSKLLTPLAILYQGITQLRNWLYDLGIFKIYHLKCRVIAVGNMTVGGTGKTPLAELIALEFQKQGKRVAIQSRGYGRRYDETIIVSDGNAVLATPEQAGDEPYLLSRHLPGVPVVVGGNRVQACQLAIKKFQPSVLILDDAFQHRRIHRDLNIVTMDASAPWGNSRLLPAGPLRENKAGLNRADLIVLTRSENKARSVEQMKYLKTWTQAPMVTSTHDPIEWVDLKNKTVHDLNFLTDQFVIAVAGIGNPQSFLTTLRSIGIKPKDYLHFPDHHWYMQHDIDRIMSIAIRHSAMAILTTEKDSVRMQGLRSLDIPIYCLKIKCTIHECEIFQQLLK